VGTNLPMPPLVTRKAVRKSRDVSQPQTIDLTANTPTVQDRNPFWTRDEQFLIFQSNRTTINGVTAPPAGSLYHIYRMRPDGTGITALTGPLGSITAGATNEQTEPSANQGGSSIVYIEKDSSGGVDLIEYNINTGVVRSVLKNNPNGFSFTALNHPEYGFAVSGTVGILFAGQRTTDTSFHLFTVDTQTGNVTQLTTGAFDDRNPTLSPDPAKPVVAFDRAPVGSPTAVRDIYVIGTNPSVQNVARVTNFSAGGKQSDNRQPSWSTNKVDQPTGSQHITNGQQLIGFASTRMDTAGDGNANAVNPNGSHDIYWLKVTVGVDPNDSSVFTVTTPESSGNPAFKLPTSDTKHIYDDTKPTWPQFISSYRVAYQSDRTFYNSGSNTSGPAGQPADIFASTLIDINAPTLVRFDAATGDVVSVTPRNAVPGSTVNISVKMADLESGIRDVWVQIKNPNSKYQSADGKEHKVYLTLGESPDGTNGVNAPIEFEMERIFIGSDPNDGRVNSYATPTFVPSIDDFFAYSGSSITPDEGWLQLTFQSRNAQTGVATYTANWKTDGFPSDYVIDVIAFDNALNPFTTGSADAAVNWKIYDNVWGFTTKNFQPAHNILFVSDNAAGQKFFGSRFGINTLVNVSNTFWGTESYMTDIDLALFPTFYIPLTGGTGGSVVNVMNTLGVMSYGASNSADGFTFGDVDPLVLDGTRIDGADVPATQQYDLWRILCRGPVPDSVLQQYAPHVEQQPPDTINGETAPRTVTVAPRCVIWHAPYTGDLFVGPGTLTDQIVQAQLHSFLSAGGRLFVNGQDVGFALTLDGSATNSFFTGDLRAQYVNDQIAGTSHIVNAGGFFPTVEFVSAAFALQTTGNPDVITFDPWRQPGDAFPIEPPHIYFGPPFPPGYRDNVANEQNFLIAGNSATNPRDLACLGVLFPDEVTPLPNVTSDMRYGDGNTYIQHYLDAATKQRVVYCAGGFEGLNSDSFVPPNTQNILALKNRRAQTMHNIVCWLRTGTITGKVLDTEAGQPLAGVLVRLINKLDANGKPITAYTALTQQDGSYVINGVESEQYAVTAVKPGFAIQKRAGQSVHGGFRSDLSFRMTKAENAIITGHVFRTDGTTPVVGATVTAKDDLTAATFTAVTDANGLYNIQNVPSGTTYTLTAKDPPDFGASIPPSYAVNDPADPTGNKLVQPAKTYGPFDFKLKPAPGIVTGFVYVNNNGAQGAPISGATVTATCSGVVLTAVTDSSGAYTFSNANNPPNGLDSGPCVLVATAPGFAASAGTPVSVIANQSVVAPIILLSTVPPGSLSGLVTRTTDNAPLSGVTIEVRDANNALVATTKTTAAQTVSGYTFNYKFSTIPAGVTYTVTAALSGYTPTPASASAKVDSGVETKNVNFTMEPLHTFSGALSMVSTPYDYSSLPQNAAELLSVSPTDPAFLMATWDLGQYVYFPTPPADKFRLGRGYFLGYKTNLPLAVEGTTANPNQPFNIALAPGWNMIGDPFLFNIDWTKVQIVDGGVVKSYDQAVSTAAISAGLYTYQSGTYILDFRLVPWRGYWVRAYRQVTLRIDPNTAGIGRAAKVPSADVANSRAALRGADGWTLNIRANVGKLHDDDNQIGVSSRATNGFDGYKIEKPPVFGKDYVYLTFDHSDWAEHSGGYGVDVRSASTTANSWTFSVQTNAPKSTASITWPNSASIGRATSLTLTDVATGEVRDLGSSSSYSWQTGDKPATRKFVVTATRNTLNGALRITSLTARGGRGVATTNLSYELTSAANVEVRILAANGSAVRKLSSRATRAAGVNDATWDQRNDQGSAVPAGAYTVEVKAISTDGKSSARQITTVIITR
jgi:5-hydroxyisourate hydrolase-like protein (transthyretin family)